MPDKTLLPFLCHLPIPICLCEARNGDNLDNTQASPITDDSVGGQRSMLLGMVTAHIAALNSPLNGQPSSTLVGRINNASEGSVSAQTENLYPPGTVQWWQQTKYGAAFWAASQQYRTMRYVPGPVRNFDPWGRGRW